jgi:hypothetical protein
MITHLHLKSSSSPGQPPLIVETPPSVTIFVGPNNAGKSQASVIVDKLTFVGVDLNIAQTELSALRSAPQPGETIALGFSFLKVGAERLQVNDQDYIHSLQLPNERLQQFTGSYLRFFTLNLDGPSRITLINSQARGDLKNPVTQLARLLTNDKKRDELRKVIYDAIGLYFAIDAQTGDKLQVRFGDTTPPDERSFNDQALAYMSAARSVDAISDGVKAYTGILVQLYAATPKS